MFVVVLGATLCLALLAMLAWELWAARQEALQIETGPYLVCERHGPLPDAALIEMEQPSGDPVKACPICYEAAFRKADEQLRREELRRESH